MSHGSKFLGLAVLALLLALTAAPVSANILVGVPTVSGLGPYTWTYQASLASGFEVNDGLNFGPPPGTGCSQASPCQGTLIIYDFAGYVPGTAFAPTDWTFQGAFTGPSIGVTPAADSASIFNLVWVYTGATPIQNTSGNNVALGAFGAESLYNLNALGQFAAQDRQFLPDNRAANLGNTFVPQVPEPATFVLMGGALLGLSLIRRRIS